MVIDEIIKIPSFKTNSIIRSYWIFTEWYCF